MLLGVLFVCLFGVFWVFFFFLGGGGVIYCKIHAKNVKMFLSLVVKLFILAIFPMGMREKYIHVAREWKGISHPRGQ